MSFLIHNKLLTIKTNKMKKIILVYIMAFFVNFTQAQENKLLLIEQIMQF